MPKTEEINELDQAMTKSYFDGVNAFTQAEPDGEEPGEGEEAGEQGAKPEGEEGKPETEEKPSGEEKAKEKDGAPEKKGTGEGEGEPEKKHLFKDLDEADERYKGLQRSHAEKDRELQEMRDKLKARESEEEWTRKVAETEQTIREKYREISREELSKINELDPEEDGYDDAVSDIRAEADLKRSALYRQHPEIISQPPKAAAEPAASQEEPGKGGEEEPGGPSEDAVEKAFELMSKRLKAEEIPEDDIVWDHFKSQAPMKDEKGEAIPFEDQLEWAITKTKDYYASRSGGNGSPESAEEKARKRQEEDLPLGGTGGDHREQKTLSGKDKPSGPKSIDDVLNEVQKDQTL